MAEHLYGRPGLVLAHRNRLEVLGPPVGPAGASGVELPDGSVWRVDHADPSIPLTLEADGDPSLSPLLVAAFGGDGALFLLERAASADVDLLGDAGSPDDRRPRPHRYRVTTGRGVKDLARQAGQLVVLADLADDDRIHPLAQLAASLELALFAPRTAVGSALRPLLPTVLSRAGQLTDEIDDHDLTLIDEEVADALRSLCQRATKIDPTPSTEIMRLIHRLDRLHFRPENLTVAAMRREHPADLDGREELPPIDAAAAPPPPAQIEPMELVRVGDALVRVRVARADSHRWVRVLHRSGLVLLGQAPLRREGLMDVAEVVVPPDVVDSDLQVQVLDVQDLAPLAGGPLAAMRAAIVEGRDAARATRLGEGTTARRRWLRCRQLWLDAGDESRAEQASELVEVAAVGGSGSWASVADEITETLVS